MAPGVAILSKKLDDLETEVHSLENPMELHFPHPSVASFRSKLSFIKSLLAAETGSTTDACSLSHIATRVSALESFFSGTDDPEVSAFDMTHVLLRKNLQELESMAKEPFLHPAAKIRSKIDFTKSLLAAEAKSEDFFSIGARLAAVEDSFGNLDETEDTQASNSQISSENNEEDCEDAWKKVAFLRPLLVAEMKGFSSNESGEFTDRNLIFDDDAKGGNVSSPCSCTSSCFDGVEEKEKKAEEEENSVSGVEETKQVVEGKSETADSEGNVEVEGSGQRRLFGRLRAIGALAGVIAVAGVGVFVGIFSSQEVHYLVPT